MDVDVFVTGGLGDNSHLLVSGGEAAVIDPQRDAWRFLQGAEKRGATVRAVLETHVPRASWTRQASPRLIDTGSVMDFRRRCGKAAAAPVVGSRAFPCRFSPV